MDRFRVLCLCAASGGLIAVLPARGQTAQAPSSSQAPQILSQPEPAAVLRAKTNLVLVDVLVTDHGKPVHGIDRRRFHVYEDEHEQKIAAFDEHQPAAESNETTPAKITPLPSNTYTNVPDYPDSGVVNVLLLDALNTPMANQEYARREMIEYLGKIPRGTSLAIFTLASRLQLIEGFTTDAARLTEVLKSKAASASQSVVTEDQSTSAQMDTENGLGQIDATDIPPDATTAILQFEADLTAFQTNERVLMTLEAFQELARYLSGFPGRKNVIWFSGSFPIDIDPDPDAHSPFRNMETYGEQIRKTSALLTAARVAVYPVDARGLMTLSTLDANYTPSPNGMSVNSQGRMTGSNSQNMSKDIGKFLTQTSEEHTSMETIAEETGGRAFVNSNDLKAALADVVEEGASYYTIAYDPGEEKLDGSFRRIKVSMDQGSYKLAYRDGYYADTGYGPGAQNPEGANLITSAILRGAPPTTQIALRARVLPGTDPLLGNVNLPTGPAGKMAATMKPPLRLYVIDLTVDAHALAFSDMADGGHEAKLEFLLVNYDAEGNRVNFQDQALDVNLKPKQFDNIMASGLHARMFLDVPRERSSLRIAVQDLSAGRAGSLEVPIGAGK
jgi:VWFA-related protein